jgi:hypothetical protein
MAYPEYSVGTDIRSELLAEIKTMAIPVIDSALALSDNTAGLTETADEESGGNERPVLLLICTNSDQYPVIHGGAANIPLPNTSRMVPTMQMIPPPTIRIFRGNLVGGRYPIATNMMPPPTEIGRLEGKAG